MTTTMLEIEIAWEWKNAVEVVGPYDESKIEIVHARLQIASNAS